MNRIVRQTVTVTPVSSPILTIVPDGTIDGTLSITFRVRGLNG